MGPLNIVNVCVEDVHVSNHSCEFFDISFPLDPPPLKIWAQRRMLPRGFLLFLTHVH